MIVHLNFSRFDSEVANIKEVEGKYGALEAAGR